MRIKAIVFDKDGTIVDFEKLWIPVTLAAANEISRRYALPRELTDEYIRSLGIIDENTVDIRGAVPRGAHGEIVGNFAKELRKTGITPNEESLPFEVLTMYDKETKQRYGKIAPTADNIREVLLNIKSRGITLALITDLFDHIIGFDPERPSKPDPYYMNEFMREFSLSPHEVVMVGDTETDILFAKNSGVYSIGVGKTEENRRILLAAGADECYHDVSFIPSWLDGEEVGE